MAIPVIAARMIAAHVTSNRNALALCTMTRPSTSFEPPKYSPTMAPIRLSVDPILRAVTKYGRAFGTRRTRRTVHSDAAYERSSSSAVGSTWVSPRVTFTTTGTKTSTATIIIFDSGLSTPNQLFMSGAKAMIGTALAPMATGRSSSRAVAKRAVKSDTTTPNRVPSPNPPTASNRVAPAALPSGQRPEVQFSASAVTMAVGVGSGNPRRSMLLTMTCQAAIVPANTTIAGR